MINTFFKVTFDKNIRNVWNICVRHQCKIPAIVMNNGDEMPLIGFGTWSATSDFRVLEKNSDGEQKTYNKRESDDIQNAPEKVAKTVRMAINAGYRHIDCAQAYKNEREIGQVLKTLIEEKTVTRENLFITSKLWNTFHHPQHVISACEQTLKDLQLEYLDMYLMHSPMGFQYGDDLFPLCDGEVLSSDDDYIDTWNAMEDLVEIKLCKNIGISNFNDQQIERLLKNCKIIPQTLQMEVHPYLTQKKLIDFAKSHDICITAYAPLGSPKRPWAKLEEHVNLLTDYKIGQLAEKHHRSPAQILLRYQIQCGHAVIPKADGYKHIEENINIFDFELCPDDVKNIESLNYNKRFFLFSGAYGHPLHPFETSKAVNT